ncbi:hypothetical protein J5N97_002696 [Dioscorea zingiberensis]|uniref:Protein kinase domain-containing protein n=1 Tax=Dioscorea zingiberensis TaxID=325984 RepID=A0A9D5D5A2_9LILI|nr:hypothetical protein J5N97_002696 [Dioscorea zingiberensis]
MLLEGDPDHLQTVVFNPPKISPWIDPNALKLTHRIGRGPFGDVWIATHHLCTDGYERYHEVAVKMLFPLKDDQVPDFLARFDEIFSRCYELEGVCFLHGVTNINGRVCVVMKFYEGSIGDKMAHVKGGKLSLSDVLRYGADLAQGIMELHSRRVFVLNLKPFNFLLDEHDRAIIGDFGIPSLLLSLSLPSSDLIQRYGTPNYMAPEQWQPNARGPISFETDSWGFGCSIVEMLSGIQPWRGKSPDEIFHLVVSKQEKPSIPTGLPPRIESVLYGCFEHDFRNRPLMSDILHAFKSCQGEDYGENSWCTMEERKAINASRTDWSLLKDPLQVGDTVRSRKPKNSCKLESMEIPEGTVVGMDSYMDREGFVLVRVHGIHNPMRVHSSTVERVTYGFAAGDWVRITKENYKKQSPVGILHSINRDGRVTVGFIGLETLWEGDYSQLQIWRPYCVGQFMKIRPTVSSPRFDWPKKRGGEWATGRISQILPNGCLVVKFPGRLSFGEPNSFLADPAEVEVVSFRTCRGVGKKYQHLEDFHWSVRPLLITLGLFAGLKLGFLIKQNVTKKRPISTDGQQIEGKQPGGQNVNNPAWCPPPMVNILFREGPPSAR